jgi:hypothetical protein
MTPSIWHHNSNNQHDAEPSHGKQESGRANENQSLNSGESFCSHLLFLRASGETNLKTSQPTHNLKLIFSQTHDSSTMNEWRIVIIIIVIIVQQHHRHTQSISSSLSLSFASNISTRMTSPSMCPFTSVSNNTIPTYTNELSTSVSCFGLVWNHIYWFWFILCHAML